ncbi:bifunctional UDP-sugar hydrolase/5'-nucleotidase [Gracilibacillus sp. S3-1-1]|uniref:Bifunctional UDP-sugar hydrolase/5'-nucleotidase n=1 Tax=Gracilibacillus pellucidus TaxID=3095368 RepID=A0ACC6M1F5_9BACI|nr:bifunctional UDP-sugar hydrolase/5'-nucleotidase [Gracilibacillus sp. S3-1-1]MDX8044731.1 bifunctional UDP-sugar hydrolase/5'-nucleotidase [Gracilibacillus sp. S3-1-1]
MVEYIHFYYCNDLHSHFEQWPSIVHYFNSKRLQHARDGEHSYRIDIGDHVDRFHPIAEAYNGKANIELLNDAEVNFATIGNNEGITLEYDDLFHLYDQAKFQVTCSNLQPLDNDKPSWLQDSISIRTKSNLHIRLFGLTAPFNPFYHPLGWNVELPHDFLAREIQALKKDADILILLSHLGYSEDQLIAERYPEIDLIIGGHTHHLLKNGEQVNNTLLTAAGKYGKYIGEVHIGWDHDQGKIVNKQAFTVQTDSVEQDIHTVKQLDTLNESAQTVLEKEVTYLDEGLTVDWFETTPILERLTDKLKDWTKADISMLNAGLLLESLEKGKVTYGDIHRICPHPINPCTVKLRGIEIIEVVRGTLDKALQQFELKGFGFRGKVIGAFHFSGIEIDTEIDQQGEERVKLVSINGQEIDRERLYTFATPDMFTFGQMFPEIARSTTKKFYLPEFMRDLLVDELK